LVQKALRLKVNILSIKATGYNIQPNKEFDTRIQGKNLLERRHVVVVDTILWLYFSLTGNNDPAVPSNKRAANKNHTSFRDKIYTKKL
jgi:hypothetical protein